MDKALRFTSQHEIHQSATSICHQLSDMKKTAESYAETVQRESGASILMV